MFSERYGYVKPSDVLIIGKITIDIQNAICSCIDRLFRNLFDRSESVGRHVWTSYLKERDAKYYDNSFITEYIENTEIEWFKKLDMVEAVIEALHMSLNWGRNYMNIHQNAIYFIDDLNAEFKKNHFAYRIIDNIVVEISNEEEIKTIEQAQEENTNNIRIHLSQALRLCSNRDTPDYRNSIKESISAVEAYCREKTGCSSLGDALNKLKKVGLEIPSDLNTAFVKLYAYTNQKDTGIRHALMVDDGTYTPTYAEAIFMVVSCSAFINYLNAKKLII